MRIGLDATWAAGAGGTASYTRGLVRALVARADHQYTLYFRPGDEVQNPLWRLDAPHVRRHVVRFPTQPGRSLLGLSRAASGDRLDLFHSPGYFLPLWRGPKVVTFHDANMFLQVGRRLGPGRRLDTLSLCVQSALSARVAARIVTVSQSAAGEIQRVFRVPDNRLSVVYPGIDEAYFNVSDNRTIHCDRYVLAVGEVIPQKNIEGMIRALALIQDKDLNLALAGTPDTLYLRHTVLPLARQLGIERRVRCLGVVPARELPALYRGATAFLFPSFAEGFGIPPLEAMASGTPVIASNRSSLPEILGQAALLVDPDAPHAIASGIDSIISDPALRASLVGRGRARAAEFRWERAAAEVICIYDSLL
ncbi:MAG: glycosyltransferase family 4 protein [Chloroflexota bacterium]|nr:glycosyltransferase family 4 protein [Chloroflexota bacterium]